MPHFESCLVTSGWSRMLILCIKQYFTPFNVNLVFILMLCIWSYNILSYSNIYSMIKLIHPKWLTGKPPTPPYPPSPQWYPCIHFLCCNPQLASEEPQSSELLFFLLLSSWHWWWGAAGCPPSCSWRSSLDQAMFEEHQAMAGNRKERPSLERYGTWGMYIQDSFVCD